MANDPSAIKVTIPAEKLILRRIIAKGQSAGNAYKECPCGWFYTGKRCPDEKCKLWIPVAPKIIELYAHVNDEDEYEEGKELGLEDEALRTFANWGYELKFKAEVDLTNGKVKLLTIDGHKIQY
jgi:hypothetical protein